MSSAPPDFDAARSTFAARVVGALRGGETLAGSIERASTIGWVFRKGDRDQTGLCWRWPGPEDFVFDDVVANDIASGWPAVAPALVSHVGRVFPASHETSGADEVSGVVIDKSARFRKQRV